MPLGQPGAAGFDPAALRAQIQQSLPQQANQQRSGQQGFLESMRGMRPPSVNLPSQGGGFPQRPQPPQQPQQQQGQGGGIQEMIARIRAQLGQQGIGQAGLQGGLPNYAGAQPPQQQPQVAPEGPGFAPPQPPQQQQQPLRQPPQQQGYDVFKGPTMDQGGGLGSQLPGSQTTLTQPTNVLRQPQSLPQQPAQPAQSRYGNLGGSARR